jgi:hypothetical protein
MIETQRHKGTERGQLDHSFSDKQVIYLCLCVSVF